MRKETRESLPDEAGRMAGRRPGRSRTRLRTHPADQPTTHSNKEE
ncbi:MAG TPA: hypothetical protein VK357_05800 [Rubrobacteraceae bacterium]|nr:hypothetical protein [Rubrobacteraceae bacterium]